MLEDHKIVIKQICKEKNVPVFQAAKVDFKFKMNKIKIQ